MMAFRSALSCARPSFIWLILDRESLSPASSDSSLCSVRDSSAFLHSQLSLYLPLLAGLPHRGQLPALGRPPALALLQLSLTAMAASLSSLSWSLSRWADVTDSCSFSYSICSTWVLLWAAWATISRFPLPLQCLVPQLQVLPAGLAVGQLPAELLNRGLGRGQAPSGLLGTWSCRWATAERRADRPASGRMVMEKVEVEEMEEVVAVVWGGEEAQGGDMERRAQDPRSRDSSGSPELSWSVTSASLSLSCRSSCSRSAPSRSRARAALSWRRCSVLDRPAQEPATEWEARDISSRMSDRSLSRRDEDEEENTT
ncbi:hypothetical protein CRUP_014965 [Coryphaenoides rupestris]|nr:hypothetical protein CRUP_014965 [Coryphaenoides rupestris]